MSNKYHHGDLEHALAETGRKMLEQEGIEKLSLRKVAAEIGVSHTAPYRHFKDKTELLAKIAEQGYTELGDAMEKCIAERKGSVPELIKQTAVEYVKQAVITPETSKLMFSGIIVIKDYPKLKEAATRAYDLLVDIIKSGQWEGDIEKYTAAVWSLIHGLSSLIQAENHSDVSQTHQVIEFTVPAVMDVLIKGIGTD
ncbi:MAG: TetR/AcrR family transcriptional regulator [Deferribacterales bacterium]